MVATGVGTFRFGDNARNAKLSNLLVQMKTLQQSSDVSAIIPVHKDPELVKTVVMKTALYEQLRKPTSVESTYRWVEESSDTFGKFVGETNAASRFANQTGTYTDRTVVTRLMSYVLKVGMIAQKNTAPFIDLLREEQTIGMEAMRKGIERCLITGAPAGASDGGVTDALAFSGLDTLVTTNIDAPTNAEAISIDKVDAAMDNCIANGALESDLIAITDTRTLTNFSSNYYNLQNAQLEQMDVAAGLRLRSYRRMPIFVSDFCPSTTALRKFYIVDTKSTVIPEFWPISQIELGKTELSDDSVMFWMGALAVKDELRNAIITKIV